MATVGSLHIDFSTNVATLISDMQKASRAVKRSSDDMTRSLRQVQGMVRMTIAAFGGFGAVRAVTGVIKDLGDLADAAEKAGTSAEKLQVWRLLGQDIGQGIAASDAALTEFTKRVGQAQAGTGKLLEVAKDYNIQLTDQSGKARSAAAIMGDLSNVIAATTDKQEQLRIAAAMGMEEFVDALGRGEEGMKNFETRVQALGLVIEEEMVQKADRFDKEWNRVREQWAVKWRSTIIETLDWFGRIRANMLGGVELMAEKMTGTDIEKRNTEVYGPPKPLPVVTGGPGMNKAREEAERVEKNIEDMKRAKTALEEYAAAAENTHQKMLDFAQDGIGSVEDALVGLITKTKSAKEAFRDMALSIVEDMVRMNVQQNITGPLSGILNSLVGSLFPRDLGGGTTISAGGVPIPGHKPPLRDSGGPVVGGQPYSVGVPEIFIPRNSGMAVPLENMGGDTYYIDARGADKEGLARLESYIRSVDGSIEKRSVAAFENKHKRSLSFGR